MPNSKANIQDRHVMRPIAYLFATLIAVFLVAGSAFAVERPYLVVDMDSGKVLADRNAQQLWYPASITKLMNAYVTFKALREGRVSLQTEVVVSAAALAEPPSKMGFKVGTVIDLDNALKMMLVHSSNDIAVAVAETVGGSEQHFVDMMNAEAARLGMSSTHFVNPNGLPAPGQATTARDLAVLARALWIEFPDRRPIFQISAIRSGKKVMKSANTLLERYRGTLGMKTGFICSSGFNIVAVAKRNGRTLIAVVLGSSNSKDRAELTARLLNDGFSKPFSLMPKATLASFRGSSPIPYVIDMRDDICRKKSKGENEAEADADGAPMVSALDPRLRMEPVAVTTLGMRNSAGKTAVTTADDTPPVPAKPPKRKTAKKKSAKAAAADGPVAPTLVDTGDAAPPRASGKGSEKMPQIEVGVPFDSTLIAPLPDLPASVTQ
jgi:D-alanyl-D-alanine carboxypeptidase